ncbi:MAG: hypothetical protein IFK92_08910, partial [Acidobacteria bacterium]|nr:hypothetical protein [Candidatus Sulfomarinibacter kjeldsenii]
MSGNSTRRLIVFLIAVVLLSMMPSEAAAQFAFGGYLGKSSTLDANLELSQPGDTDLTFHDVGWYDESWVNPKYYGFRLTYWKKSDRRWGYVLDFTHAKMYGELDSTVHVTGTRAGEPVDGDEILGDTFEVLAFSHGHNTLTFNGFFRWLRPGP